MIKIQIHLKTGLNSELLLLCVFQVIDSEIPTISRKVVENSDIKTQALLLKKTENHCTRALLFQVNHLDGELFPSGRITGAFENLMKYSYSLHTQKGYMHTPTHSFAYNFR